MGTYQAGASLARALVPLVSGAIYANFGPSAPFFVGAAVTAPAAWLVWRAVRAPLPGDGSAPRARQHV
jgi:hypothetical protein